MLRLGVFVPWWLKLSHDAFYQAPHALHAASHLLAPRRRQTPGAFFRTHGATKRRGSAGLGLGGARGKSQRFDREPDESRGDRLKRPMARDARSTHARAKSGAHRNGG